ncbi:MAG: hypothetical protein ACRDUY_08115 [Nitriliruptorales bacterium]
MRYTLGDVTRAPSRLSDWRYELPWRRKPLHKLRVLLFTRGQGERLRRGGDWSWAKDPEWPWGYL